MMHAAGAAQGLTLHSRLCTARSHTGARSGLALQGALSALQCAQPLSRATCCASATLGSGWSAKQPYTSEHHPCHSLHVYRPGDCASRGAPCQLCRPMPSWRWPARRRRCSAFSQRACSLQPSLTQPATQTCVAPARSRHCEHQGLTPAEPRQGHAAPKAVKVPVTDPDAGCIEQAQIAPSWLLLGSINAPVRTPGKASLCKAVAVQGRLAHRPDQPGALWAVFLKACCSTRPET